MIRSRLGLRAMGLCLALAGLMAVGASSAQAGGNWLVEGKAVTNALKVELAGTLENNTGTLLGAIAGVGIHISCTGVTFSEGGLQENGGVEGKVQFSGCTISRLKGAVVEPLTPCTPNYKKAGEGLITSNLGKGLLSLHVLPEGKGTHTVTVLEPSSGAVFTTITTGEECSFGEKITISGKLTVVDAAATTSQATHLITEFKELTELYINGNKANKATIDGSGEIKLAKEHAGLKWAADPA